MANAAIAWALSRLKEPSTWAGLAGIVATMSFLPHASQDAQVISVVGAAIASVLAVIIPEVAKT